MRLEDVKALKKQQEEALRYRRFLYSDSDWEQFEDYWLARYPLSSRGEGNLLPVPVLTANMQRMMASLVGGEFRTRITSDYPDQVPAARVLSARMDHLNRVTRLLDEVLDAVQDAGTLGTGFLLDGWGSQFGVSRDTVTEGVDTSRTDKDNNRIEYHNSVYEDQPWTLRVHPFGIHIPAGTVRLAGAYGFFHEYTRHIDDVQKDDKLQKKHRIKIKPNAHFDYAHLNVEASSVGNKEKNELVQLVDWYNFKNSKRVTFSPEYPFALSDEVDEIMLRIDRLPLHAIIFNSNSRYFWGTSDFDFQEPLAHEINDIRHVQSLLRRLQVVKGFFDKRMIENPDDLKAFDKAIKNMTSDQAMAMIGIEGNPKDFLAQFTPYQPFDLIPQLDIAKKEIEEFGQGIGPIQKGQVAGGRHTKYETQTAEGHYDQSMFPRRQRIRQVLIEITENRAKLIFEFQDKPELVQTYNAAGLPVVVEFTGADLRGDYRYDISLESMRVKSKDERVEEANMILSQLSPFIQAGIVAPKPLLRQYLVNVAGPDWDIESIMEGYGNQTQQPQPFGQFQQEFQQQAGQRSPSPIGAMLGGQIPQGVQQ